MSPTDLLLPPGCDLLVSEMAMTEELLVVVATPTDAASRCPLCGTASERIHSRYDAAGRSIASINPLNQRTTTAYVWRTKLWSQSLPNCRGMDLAV